MDDPLGINDDPHMGDLPILMIEEDQITGFRFGERRYLMSTGRLLRGVTRQFFIEQAHHDLRKTGAVHPHRVLSAPKIRDIEEEPHRLQQILFVEIETFGDHHTRVDTKTDA